MRLSASDRGLWNKELIIVSHFNPPQLKFIRWHFSYMLFITSVKACSMISLHIIGRIIILFLLMSVSVFAVYMG